MGRAWRWGRFMNGKQREKKERKEKFQKAGRWGKSYENILRGKASKEASKKKMKRGREDPDKKVDKPRRSQRKRQEKGRINHKENGLQQFEGRGMGFSPHK